MKTLRRAAFAVSLLALLCLAGSSRAGPNTGLRVVVLGFDGASADRVEKLMVERKLPNLEQLARMGYSRLLPSNPAQSPVSWATITTGLNPGRTGIYDFLRRRTAKNGRDLKVEIGLAEEDPSPWRPIPPLLRVALLLGAGAAGGAAAIGL